MLNRLQESDIKLLRVFYAVASCNGFTAAEPVLRMQRPNISAAIKKLEERLDLVLCHRGRGGFQMTKKVKSFFRKQNASSMPSITLYSISSRFTMIILAI
ncbi:hypothetical protein ALT785_30040 [Alteromonas infernus]